MNNIILNRDNFLLTENYESYLENDTVNEGFLDFIKGLFKKKEWSSMTPYDDITKALEKIDNDLTGFRIVKLQNINTCNNIRIELNDFAHTLYKSKMKNYEENKKIGGLLMGLKSKDDLSDEDKKAIEKACKNNKFLKQFDIKDVSLADKLETNLNQIKELCDGNSELIKWSNLLKNRIRNVINDAIIAKIDDDKLKEQEEKIKEQQEEEKKKEEEKNKLAQKKQEEKIKELQKNREESFNNMGITPLKDMPGDKAYDEMMKSIKNITSELGYDKLFESILLEGGANGDFYKNIKPILSNDKTLGFANLVDILKKKTNAKTLLKRIMKEYSSMLKVIDELKYKEKLKDTKSDAVQALFVGLLSVISYGVIGDEKLISDEVKELLARCSIDSDKTIGYGLPLVDDNKPDKGNIFTSIITAFAKNNYDESKHGKIFKGKDLDGKESDAKTNFDNFKKLIKKLFGDIKKKAEKIKKDAAAENEKEMKEEENNEKKEQDKK